MFHALFIPVITSKLYYIEPMRIVQVLLILSCEAIFACGSKYSIYTPFIRNSNLKKIIFCMRILYTS